MKLPKISIIIPSCNKVDYIEKTLESIFSQKYPNLEVVVQDGGSTDGTLDIIKKYAKKYPQILSWESKEDNGQVEAINEGLNKAVGDIVTFINADDFYEKDAFAKIANAFQKNRNVLLVAGKGKVVDKKGIEIVRWATRYKNTLLKINRYKLLLIVNYFTQPSIFISSEAYEKYGPFKGWNGIVAEYDMWLKIGREQMPVIVANTISAFRVTGEAISTNLFKEIFKKDLLLVSRYTKNPIILLFHFLHNLARISVLFLIKLL